MFCQKSLCEIPCPSKYQPEKYDENLQMTVETYFGKIGEKESKFSKKYPHFVNRRIVKTMTVCL